jgi:hypothetical protein
MPVRFGFSYHSHHKSCHTTEGLLCTAACNHELCHYTDDVTPLKAYCAEIAAGPRKPLVPWPVRASVWDGGVFHSAHVHSAQSDVAFAVCVYCLFAKMCIVYLVD